MDKDQLDGLLARKLVAGKCNFTATAKTLRVSSSATSKMSGSLIAAWRNPPNADPAGDRLMEASERFLSQAGLHWR
jgi:hypothetical protein